jgi:hypothetical protein
MAIGARRFSEDKVCATKVSFGQQPYLREIHQDHLPVLVDAEVAGVHVGLGEHEAITDGRQLLLGLGQEQRVRLAQIAC